MHQNWTETGWQRKNRGILLSISILFLFAGTAGGAKELNPPDVILPGTEQDDVPQPAVYPDPSSGWLLKNPGYRRIYQMKIEISSPQAPFRTLFPDGAEALLKKSVSQRMESFPLINEKASYNLL